MGYEREHCSAGVAEKLFCGGFQFYDHHDEGYKFRQLLSGSLSFVFNGPRIAAGLDAAIGARGAG
jgi:hypothetical protein